MGGGDKKSMPAGVEKAKAGFAEMGELSKGQMEQAYGYGGLRQEYDQAQWDKNKERLSGIDEGYLDYTEDALRRNKEMYQPIEEQYLDKVKNYDTETRRTSESAAAQAEVASQFDAARTNALRRLESYGVDPSQTRNSALDAEVRIEEAKAKAGGATTARRHVEDTGMALEAGTLGRGDNLVGVAKGAIPTFGQNTTQLFDQGNKAYENYGDQLANVADIDSEQQSSEQGGLSSIGSIAGGIAGAYFGGPAGAAAGSAIGSKLAEGGEVKGPGGPKDDAIPIQVSDGEFVIPEEVVRRKGTEFFDKIIQKVKTENAEREENAQYSPDSMAIPPPEAVPPEGIPGMAMGGEVRQTAPINYPPPPTMSMGGY